MEPVWRGISEGSTGFAQAAQAMFAGGRPGSALAEGVAGLSGRREPAEQSAGMRSQLPGLQLPERLVFGHASCCHCESGGVGLGSRAPEAGERDHRWRRAAGGSSPG